MDVRDINDACSLIAEEQDHENVIFRCTELVDVDICDAPCDWEVAKQACKIFTTEYSEGTKHLIVHDLDSENHYRADSYPRHYATTTLGSQDVTTEKTTCSVIGCNTVHKDTTAKQSFTLPPTKSCRRYTNVSRVENICKFHFSRLSRKQPLWTKAELDHDPTLRCSTQTSDPGSCTLQFTFTDTSLSRACMLQRGPS